MKHKTKRFGRRGAGAMPVCREVPGSLQSWLPIRDIREGVILTRAGDHIKLLEILPINFRYLSDEEQTRIVGYFAGYLKIAPDTLQILCVTREPDVTAYIRRMQELRDKEPSRACRDMIDDNIRTVHQYASSGALTTRFFLAFRFEPATMALHGEGFEAIADALYDAEETARQYLSRCGLSVVQPDYADNFVVETVYSLLCKQTSRTEKLPLYFRTMLTEVGGGERNEE